MRKTRLADLHTATRCVVMILVMALTLDAASQMPTSSQPTFIQVPGGKVEVTLPDEPMTLSAADLLNWIKNSAGAVSTYYGRFPVTHLSLRIRAGSGSSIRRGVTYPTNGGLILITVGREATTQALADDWVLTHEMIHLAFPSMADEHHWIEEGISTYVEPVARAQAGQLSVTEVWKQFIRDMPQGQPDAGDKGLDHTPTWGRTYWGGALFWFLADVEIRERTGNQFSLQDALRRILAEGGTVAEGWSLDRALSAGDRAIALPVLKRLYERMRASPAPVDLDALFERLGVRTIGTQISFDDRAPIASVRRGITAPGAESSSQKQ